MADIARSIPLALALLAAGAPLAWAQGPKVTSLETQAVRGTTYFRVRFQWPADVRLPRLEDNQGAAPMRAELARLPRLVPQDDVATAVYPQLRFRAVRVWNNTGGRLEPSPEIGLPWVEELEFLGKVAGGRTAKLLLLYPAAADAKKSKVAGEIDKLFLQQGSWGEAAVALDFTTAKTVPLPEPGYQRKAGTAPDALDLEGQWAVAQAKSFAVLEALAPEFGFYGFARIATGRRYQVPLWQLPRPWGEDREELVGRRAYDLTTGTTAITESLAMHRMRNPGLNRREERTVDIDKIQGVDIAEHPWVRMMAGQKPTPEPLARLVPHDNYYVHFKSIVKFLELGDLSEAWATTATRAFEVHSRDYRVKERLERQLCMKASAATRLFGPAVVKSLALTGSDPYIREGSDVTVIFQAANKALLLAALEPQLEEARKTWGARLKATKVRYLETDIESYVTPLREVSLHRATFEDFVVCGNSAAGVRRVLATYRGQIKPLADALDFQYMRTVFRLEDPKEHGFVFLSDPFIRNLVGPALRIKERRRLEALTSLYMTTHAALFTAWETGTLPADHKALLAHAGLKPADLYVPDGAGAAWDKERQLATSDVYNTIAFATPLIELPIDKVTDTERGEYEAFRREYLGLWRQFFDPIGMRFGLDQDEVRWETYVLPLIQLSQYNDLRRLTGDGTIKTDASRVSPRALAQFTAHLSPNAAQRADLDSLFRMFSRDIPSSKIWLGDWFALRFDDDPVYQKMLERRIGAELQSGRASWFDDLDLLFQTPVVFSVEIRNPLVFAGILAGAKKTLDDVLPGVDWKPLEPDYKGVKIMRIKARPDQFWHHPDKRDIEPALHYAMVEGAFHISPSVAAIKDIIDRASLRRDGQLKSGPAADVNTSLQVSPRAAVKARKFLEGYLEWEAHRRAQANLPLLHPLYRAGLMKPDDDARAREAVAMRFLGFIPVSPDDAPYSYERRTDEMRNRRHGTLRQPILLPGIDEKSPLARTLDEFQTIRADMRFREDGLHATVILKRR